MLKKVKKKKWNKTKKKELEMKVICKKWQRVTILRWINRWSIKNASGKPKAKNVSREFLFVKDREISNKLLI